jgi:hypothetical protein
MESRRGSDDALIGLKRSYNLSRLKISPISSGITPEKEFDDRFLFE